MWQSDGEPEDPLNSKSQVDKVDIVVFCYHGEWYTLLMIDIIDWNDLEKLVNAIYVLIILFYEFTLLDTKCVRTLKT